MQPIKIDPKRRFISFCRALAEKNIAEADEMDARLRVERAEKHIEDMTPEGSHLLGSVATFDFENVFVCQHTSTAEDGVTPLRCEVESRRVQHKTWREEQLLYCDAHCPKPAELPAAPATEAKSVEPLSGPDITF